MIEHWVETSWSGELVDRDLEKEIQDQVKFHDKDLPTPDLDFENGPGGNKQQEAADAKIMGSEAAWCKGL